MMLPFAHTDFPIDQEQLVVPFEKTENLEIDRTKQTQVVQITVLLLDLERYQVEKLLICFGKAFCSNVLCALSVKK